MEHRRQIGTRVAVAAVVFAAVGYAATVSGALPRFDTGADAVTGFTAGRVHYTLDPTTPEHVRAVTFTLRPADAGTVALSATLSTGGPVVYRCTTDPVGTVTCPTTDPPLRASRLTGITVVAAP